MIIVNGPARSAVHASYAIANHTKKGLQDRALRPGKDCGESTSLAAIYQPAA
jgi:hypothetical protein